MFRREPVVDREDRHSAAFGDESGVALVAIRAHGDEAPAMDVNQQCLSDFAVVRQFYRGNHANLDGVGSPEKKRVAGSGHCSGRGDDGRGFAVDGSFFVLLEKPLQGYRLHSPLQIDAGSDFDAGVTELHELLDEGLVRDVPDLFCVEGGW